MKFIVKPTKINTKGYCLCNNCTRCGDRCGSRCDVFG
ncbi:Clo7bot family Cys-rich peptide [Thermoanaerobacterium sp. R66]|nr:Clo7bot family Cys-rich peptide [Thermoanaerobacterium sp. R66]MDE4543198.1 Clo7bot family Cys-rich peptide [Thermoanaerobacterium sp. R66]